MVIVKFVILIDASSKISGDFIDHFLNVGANALVVSGDVSAFGVVNEPVHVFGTVVVDISGVSAPFVAVVTLRCERVLVTHLVRFAAWGVHVRLSGSTSNQKR